MKIYSRSEWGARYSDGFGPAPIPAEEVWGHHTVTLAPDLVWIDANGDNVDDDERAAMRELEQIGQDRFGGGISYTWLIMPSGRVYQGHSPWRQGAHTGGRNDIARAIAFVGNYQTNRPTEEQLRSAAELLRYAQTMGWTRYARMNGGHRDLKATACPGDFVYEAIPEINRLAAVPPEEDDMPTADEIAKALMDQEIPNLVTEGEPLTLRSWFAWMHKNVWQAKQAAVSIDKRQAPKEENPS